MLEPIDLSQNPDYWKWKLHGDITLLEFTGQNDKNGKEVYEGDVVRLGIPKRNPKKYVSYLVKFEHGSFFPKTLYEGIWELVGNIYENPDLVFSKYE